MGAIIPVGEYKVAMKCDACIHMEEPACVNSCPTGALVYGDEETYIKVLNQKRGRLAVFARASSEQPQPNLISLDFVRKE
jgi:carbon-monoxide dehydrogenase iron sulfur subunit